MMERADASTVSETVIDVRLQTIEVSYQATALVTGAGVPREWP